MLYPCEGLGKYRIDQQFRAGDGGVVEDYLPDGVFSVQDVVDFVIGQYGRCFDGFEHEFEPRIPVAALAYAHYLAIIKNKAAQKKDRVVEQTFIGEIVDIENPTRTPIPVAERVNSLEFDIKRSSILMQAPDLTSTLMLFIELTLN